MYEINLFILKHYSAHGGQTLCCKNVFKLFFPKGQRVVTPHDFLNMFLVFYLKKLHYYI